MRKQSYFKICSYLGENIWSSPKCSNFKKKKWKQVQRQPLGISDQNSSKREAHLQPNTRLYGLRLRAKQRFRKYYGNLTERQFQTLYKKIQVKNNLPGLLESRLDVVVYRMNLAPTMFSARQLINHGVFLVNKKRVTVKGFLLNSGDTIEIADSFWSRIFTNILQRLKKNSFFISPPAYLEIDYKTLCGIFVRRPLISEIPYPVSMNFDLVKEFYRHSS
jgi:small subunit ribosomal protein S4